MPNKSDRVDAYIENAAEFAQPILRKIRAAMHKASSELEENIKWGNPTFELNGIVAGMSAFKKHVNFGFWRGEEMEDPTGRFEQMGNSGVNNLKLTDVSELPSQKVFVGMIRQAVKIQKEVVAAQGKKGTEKKVSRPRRAAKALDMADDLRAALNMKKHAKAKKTFDEFSNSHRNEYIQWITEAKREATREKRLAQTLEWLAEGKPKNWKYR